MTEEYGHGSEELVSHGLYFRADMGATLLQQRA